MTITPHLFASFLKCQTKCWLKFNGEPPSGNTYAEWVQTQNESYRADAARRLTADLPAAECDPSPGSSRREEAHYSADNLKTAKWRLALDVLVRIELRSNRDHEAQTSPPEIDQSLLTSAATIAESRLHTVERIPSEGRGKAAQFVPTRFIFTNKLGKDDKLLLAFNAFVLSQLLGREVSLGKIIHGDDHATLKVKTSALAGEVRKRLEKITALLSSPAPPDLVLNRHCAECEFQARCRKIAVEKDDLSLLANMSAKERQKLRSKGIFTVTQLSYTFRPRRRPKRLRDKREKYHHALKALAIREKKIHIVGSPELKIEGTPVYLDVEGLPDRDFYYLIGLRIGHGDSAVQHSLWADTVGDEGKIWREFLAILETVEKPVLIHYGSYETIFLKQITERHGSPQAESVAAKAIATALNLVSVMFAKIYFPIFSNGLKEIAGWLGYQWTENSTSGLRSICWRHEWDQTKQTSSKQTLLTYNSDDCAALERVTHVFLQVCLQPLLSTTDDRPVLEIAHADALASQDTMWPKFTSPIDNFESINKAGRWDYQRHRIYVRTDSEVKCATTAAKSRNKRAERVNKEIHREQSRICPECLKEKGRYYRRRTKTLYDVRFTKFGIRRWVVRYHITDYRCPTCHRCFGTPKEFWRQGKYGHNLIAFVVFQVIELCIPQRTVGDSLNRLFRLGLAQPDFNRAFYLPRLPREYYQGDAVIHWTLPISHRRRGWLDERFHAAFRELMLHTAVREGLFCPTYCLMPDHLHLVWMGLHLDSDQLNGMAFLRTHLKPKLAPQKFQHQAHDHVLKEKERQRNAFAKVCFYIIDNARVAEMVKHPKDWSFAGAVVPGYPTLHPLRDDFWPKFWKLYAQGKHPDAEKIIRPSIR